jgi:hypothetical protein
MKIHRLIDTARRAGDGWWHRIVTWRDEPERGDVPGWVLITVMTAGLVAALWLVAEPLLSGLFTSAVSGVTGP